MSNTKLTEELHVTVTGWRRNAPTSRLSIDAHHIDLKDASDRTAYPIDLAQVRDLHLSINTGNLAHSVCDVQDILFTFLGHMQPLQLRSLSINIAISMPGDNYTGYDIFTSNYAERMFRQNTMREFRSIHAGELSRPHLTAFLTDPLKSIRGLTKRNFSLKYTGETGNPWKEIKSDVRDLIQGTTQVGDYETFGRYFAYLRPVVRVHCQCMILCGHRLLWT